MSQQTVKDNQDAYSGSSLYNALSFMVGNAIKDQVNTADVVIVTGVESGGIGATGYVTVKPLVCQIDGFKNVIQPVEQFKLPYSRIQGGKAALIIDPEVGDIGIAIYTKSDSSNVGQEQSEPVQPGSFRLYDISDGFYIGGFLNKPPEIYIEMDQDNNARLVAPTSVTVETKDYRVNCETFTVNASAQAGINANSWAFNSYDGSGTGTGTINANLTQNGYLHSTGDHTAQGISLAGHTHPGVMAGGSNTGTPNT